MVASFKESWLGSGQERRLSVDGVRELLILMFVIMKNVSLKLVVNETPFILVNGTECTLQGKHWYSR